MRSTNLAIGATSVGAAVVGLAAAASTIAPAAGAPTTISNSSHRGSPNNSTAAAVHPASTAVIARPGQQGDAVVALQSHLYALGYLREPLTGYYGPRTTQAVTAFQRHHHLRQTGIDDHTTDTTLNRAFDADPHRGWITSIIRTRTGWTMTVTKGHPCIIGDTSTTCHGHMPDASDVNDVATGPKTLTLTTTAQVFLLHGSTPGPWQPLTTALNHRTLSPAAHPLISWSYDGHGHVNRIQEEYRP